MLLALHPRHGEEGNVLVQFVPAHFDGGEGGYGPVGELHEGSAAVSFGHPFVQRADRFGRSVFGGLGVTVRQHGGSGFGLVGKTAFVPLFEGERNGVDAGVGLDAGGGAVAGTILFFREERC